MQQEIEAADSADRTAAEGRLTPNLQGALWILSAGVAATVMTVAVRYLSFEIDSRMIAFLRCALSVPLVLAAHFAPLALGRPVEKVRFSRPWLHVLRGALTAGALTLGFYAIGVLPMATATILFFLAPIFATVLAVPMLAQRVGPRRAAAVAVGFVGAMVILRPGWVPFDWGMAAAIGSAALLSVVLLISRLLAPSDGAKSVLLSTTVVAGLVTLPIALPVWALPDGALVWFWVGVVVLASTARTYCDIRGYAVGEVSFIAPFSYFRLIFIALVGWLLFSESIDVWTALGGAVIIGSTLYIARREARLRIGGGGAA